MFSLGNVALWKYDTSTTKSLTEDVAELFVTKVLGAIILKLKYKNVVYAVSKDTNDTAFKAGTSDGVRYFYYAEFDELKKNIKANSH